MKMVTLITLIAAVSLSPAAFAGKKKVTVDLGSSNPTIRGSDYGSLKGANRAGIERFYEVQTLASRLVRDGGPAPAKRRWSANEVYTKDPNFAAFIKKDTAEIVVAAYDPTTKTHLISALSTPETRGSRQGEIFEIELEPKGSLKVRHSVSIGSTRAHPKHNLTISQVDRLISDPQHPDQFIQATDSQTVRYAGKYQGEHSKSVYSVIKPDRRSFRFLDMNTDPNSLESDQVVQLPSHIKGEIYKIEVARDLNSLSIVTSAGEMHTLRIERDLVGAKVDFNSPYNSKMPFDLKRLHAKVEVYKPKASRSEMRARSIDKLDAIAETGTK